jgi:two-component system sensor histidine kinase CpxA
MRSLFFKIFISFMVITLFASISTALIFRWAHVGPYNQLRKRMLEQQFLQLNQTLDVTGAAVAHLLQNGGSAEVVCYLQDLENLGGDRILLVKKEASFTGSVLPVEATALVAKVRRTGQAKQREVGDEILVARFLSPESRDLILVGLAPRLKPSSSTALGQKKGLGSWSKPVRFGRPPGLPIPIMIVIAAVGCFFLARSLTSPIRALRKAAQKMTRGDFSARVAVVGADGNEIADLSRDFNIMAERTESVLESQKRLLRDISHELRTPLTRQNVALELTVQQFPDAKPYLARIGKESNRLNVLIDHLLLLTRLEGDADAASQQPVQLQELLADIAKDARFEATGKNRRVHCCLTDITIMGSEEMLNRAFENIIRNGVRHTAPGTTVEVDLLQIGREALVTVRDKGTGVPEEYLEQIFKPFFRVEKSRDRGRGGAGIGLAIARKSVQLHGGTIQAVNHKEGGLVVEVRLPMQS